MSTCDRIEELRDYAFDELPSNARRSVEQHLGVCPDCVAELDRLQLTTAALRILPDQEMPRRIAFVSDKVFQNRFGSLWSAVRGSWLGFASACVLAAAIVVAAYHRPPVTVVAQKVDVSAVVNAAVKQAVAESVKQVRAEDVRQTQELLAAAEQKHEREHNALMATVKENLNYLQQQYGTMTMLASSDARRMGAGQ